MRLYFRIVVGVVLALLPVREVSAETAAPSESESSMEASDAARSGVAEATPRDTLPPTLGVRLPEGPSPRVFLTPEEVEALRRRAAEQEWAEPVARDILRRADAFATEPLDIPRAGGQWTHFYTCDDDGGRLRAQSPTEHVCPNCKRVFSGEPYDSVYVTHRHVHWLTKALETLAMAYTLDPKPEYAERARSILLEYADFYRSLPLRDLQGELVPRAARLSVQTLDESVYTCHIAFAYDLVRAAPCFTPEDHATLAEGLLRPLVETVRRNDRGVSNWQTWHNAAVCAVGLLLGDAEMVDWSINGPSGLLFQLANGSVLESGMWYEEAPSYHWYSLRALSYHLECAKRAGMDFYRFPIVRRLFDAPIRQLLPDLTFPPIHNSNRERIRDQRRFYEIAFREYADPVYAALAAPRDSPWALFQGVDAFPPPAEDELRFASSNDLSDGLAILRDAKNETTLHFDYGAGKNWHNHPAKLAIILFAHGDIRFRDAGRLPYGNPLHEKYFMQTIAHNTVTVNGRSQVRGPGELLAFASTEDFDIVRARTDAVYENVILDRTILRRGRLILDVFVCQAPAPARFDLALHLDGAPIAWPEGEPVAALGEADGYPHLREPRKIQHATTDSLDLRLDTGDGRTIRLVAQEPSTVYRAESFATADASRFRPMLLRRIEGRDRAVFVAAYRIGTETEDPVPIRLETSADPEQQSVSVKADAVRLVVGAAETRVGLAIPSGADRVYRIGLDGAERIAPPVGASSPPRRHAPAPPPNPEQRP